MPRLEIRERSTADRRDATVRTIDVPGDRTTIRELIRLHVAERVGEYNATGPDVLIDRQVQYERATAAFAAGAIALLVDGRQERDLDTEIDLAAGPEITFLRLVPLVGG